jgi:cardiolipin synthase
MHAKYALVDHDWAAVGSYNAVPSSATVTVESALLVERPDFVSQVAGQFRTDLGRARPVTSDGLSGRRPGARLVDRLCHGLLRVGGGLVRAVS